MLTSMDAIREKALTLPRQTVAVACAQDAEALKAVGQAHALGLANFILVGNTDKIKKLADRTELDLTAFELVDARGEADLPRLRGEGPVPRLRPRPRRTLRNLGRSVGARASTPQARHHLTQH